MTSWTPRRTSGSPRVSTRHPWPPSHQGSQVPEVVCQQQLLGRLGQLGRLGLTSAVFHWCHLPDYVGHLLAKSQLQVVKGGVSVLDDVVQNSRLQHLRPVDVTDVGQGVGHP